MNNNKKDYKQYTKAVYAGLDRLKTVQLNEVMVKENKMLSVLDKPATYGYAEIANYEDVMEVYENMDVNHDVYGKIKLKEFFEEVKQYINDNMDMLERVNNVNTEYMELDSELRGQVAIG